jgi:hypothetical protein
MSNTIESIFYGDNKVRVDDKGFFSLTDMWSAAGKPEGKHDPRRWSHKAGSEFIGHIADNYNVPSGDIYKTTKGRYGSTYAHWQIALAYAKYLSPEFHAWANQVVKDRIEETENPELGITRSKDRAIGAWRKQGKNEKFIQARLAGMDTRRYFTDTLKDHGVTSFGYGNCTNGIYTPILGGTAAEAREARGLPKGGNLRDSFSVLELTGTMFAEALASDTLERQNMQGNNSCISVCFSAGMQVKKTLNDHQIANSKSAKREALPATKSKLASRIEKIRDSRLR